MSALLADVVTAVVGAVLVMGLGLASLILLRVIPSGDEPIRRAISIEHWAFARRHRTPPLSDEDLGVVAAVVAELIERRREPERRPTQTQEAASGQKDLPLEEGELVAH